MTLRIKNQLNIKDEYDAKASAPFARMSQATFFFIIYRRGK